MRLEFIEVDHRDALSELAKANINLYGPLYITTDRISSYNFTNPIGEVDMCGIWRSSENKHLQHLPQTENFNDLKKHNYQVTILAESCSEDFAFNILNLAEENITICESFDEILERLTLSSIKRGAHLTLCDELTAKRLESELPDSLQVKSFKNSRKTRYPIAFAIDSQHSWLINKLSEAYNFISDRGLTKEILTKHSLEKTIKQI